MEIEVPAPVRCRSIGARFCQGPECRTVESGQSLAESIAPTSALPAPSASMHSPYSRRHREGSQEQHDDSVLLDLRLVQSSWLNKLLYAQAIDNVQFGCCNVALRLRRIAHDMQRCARHRAKARCAMALRHGVAPRPRRDRCNAL
jgi:hypothetical protein